MVAHLDWEMPLGLAQQTDADRRKVIDGRLKIKGPNTQKPTLLEEENESP